jgi:hypothetical protein
MTLAHYVTRHPREAIDLLAAIVPDLAQVAGRAAKLRTRSSTAR